MHLKKINIKRFRVLNDIDIHFQTPSNGENVVNVFAGVNGCGKTSLLEVIFENISNPHSIALNPDKYNSIELTEIGEVNKDNWTTLNNLINELNKKNANNFSFEDSPRIIYLPSQQNFQYSSISQLIVNYTFHQKIDTNAILGQAEFYIKEYIINHERASDIQDPKNRTKNAVDNFNANFLDAELLTKLCDLSKKQFNRPIFNNSTSENEEVTIDQLSDGEKQLYARVIALMILEPKNSIILIDEPEIALHPSWQQKIMQIYSRIGKNNQFIIATHSAQVISSVPYQNRILLCKKNKKIQAIHLNQPPSGIDVNSILSEIMGAESIPNEIKKLHSQYRYFVEKHEESSNEAINIKKEILNHENEHSAFMQEMDFLIELREA